MDVFKIRIRSGDYRGRYVGDNIGGLITNQELLKNREVKIPGTRYSLYAQEGGAKGFFAHAAPAVQAELQALGYETELVEVEL
ncbi:MAG: hypothetical protein ACLPTQ_20535 [Terriglobales bacterium]|jgi:hypothetical protein